MHISPSMLIWQDFDQRPLALGSFGWTAMVPVYLPARCVRCLKAASVTFIITFFVLCFVLLVIVADQPRSRVIKTKSESLEVFVERTGLCNRMQELYTGNLTNATVETICRNIRNLEREYFRARETKVNPFQHELIINGAGICNNRTDVVLIIHSLHSYTERRQAIRNTWGGASIRNAWPRANIPKTVKMAFIFGVHPNNTFNAQLREENNKYGDIIQGDFQESYQNMTFKSLLGLKWVSEFCPSAKYMIKSDDDMIVNMPALLKVLSQRDMTKAIMGPLNMGSRVYRRGKWKLDLKTYPFYFFPTYESGSAYVISQDLVQPLFNISEYVPSLFIDDVYITGILGKILNITHIQQPGFAFWIDKKPKACSVIENQILTGTKMTPEYMTAIWKDIVKGVRCYVKSSSRLV